MRAVAQFEEFRQWSDKTKRGLDGHERQWFAKGETAVLRLAGTLAYMAWAIALGTPSANGLDWNYWGVGAPKNIDERFITEMRSASGAIFLAARTRRPPANRPQRPA